MHRIVPVLASALMLGLASPVLAATELENLQTYCKPDIERLCHGVALTGIKECLKAHEMQISVGCAQALKALKD